MTTLTEEQVAARNLNLAKAREARAEKKAARVQETARVSAWVSRPDAADDGFELLRPDGTPQREQPEADTLSRTDLFRARARNGAPISTADDLESLGGEDTDILERGGGSNVEHSSAGLVWMYKHETWGWRRLKVSRNSVDDLLKAGLLDRCGACHSAKCPGTVNGCPKGQMRPYVDCPVAGCNDGHPKRFYDMQDVTPLPEAEDDPLALRIDLYHQSTPASRIKAQLDSHIRAYHETTAIEMGLFNVQQATV